MSRLGVFLLGVIVLVSVLTTVVQSWPSVGSAPSYECCCDNPQCGNGGCFVCRNHEFTCECSTCSCYNQRKPVVIKPSENDFLQMLYRSSFGGGRFRRSARLGAHDDLAEQ